MTDKRDAPFYEIIAEIQEHIAAGAFVFQKFTCKECGNRLTMDAPNVFYKWGTCDKCHALTNIEEQGCGFALVAALDPEMQEPLAKIIRERQS